MEDTRIYADDLWFAKRIEGQILGFPFDMLDSIKDGRFWVAEQRGRALMQTSRTIKGVHLMKTFGLNVMRHDIDQCDECNGLMPKSYMHEAGPTVDGEMVAVVIFCNGCYPQ